MKHKKYQSIGAISIYILVAFCLIIPMAVSYADEGTDQTANQDIVRELSLSYKLNDTTDFVNLESPYEIPDSTAIDSFHAHYTFALEDNVTTEGLPDRTVQEGDYYLIDLPKEIQLNAPADGSILDEESNIIANYSFIQNLDDTWEIKVTFTDYVNSTNTNRYDIHGWLDFDFTLDLSGVEGGTTDSIYIPIDSETSIDLEVTKPVPAPTTPLTLEKTAKSYNDSTRQLVWNVKMTPATGVFSGCTFSDTIDVSNSTLDSIKHGSVTLVRGTDYTYNDATGEIVYLIPAGRDGTAFQNITITTTVNKDVYGEVLPTTISNQATLTGGAEEVDLTSNEATQTVTPDWLTKSGTTYQGNKILWTIDANNTNQQMFNGVITDTISSDLVLDETSLTLNGTTNVVVHDNTYTPLDDTEVYATYSENVLKVYLPRGMTNADTATQVITFVTSIDEPAALGDPSYTNTATLDANYVRDDGTAGTIGPVNVGIIGVAVPNVSVVKSNSELTDADKSNGTIPWTITAVSNLTDYGKATIVDTLPLGQTYIADEIYLGSLQLTSTTEPAANISEDGRTLTITFNTNNALQTIQNFKVKTKIDSQIYGLNVDADFTNQVEATIYDTSGAVLDSDTDTHSVNIVNDVITKTPVVYNGNDTENGENPRVDFDITINGNQMPLSNVIVTDDLSNIVTQFKKSGETTYTTVDGVTWKYVPGTLKITKAAGTSDSLDLAAIESAATYNSDDVLTVDFGSGVSVNDKYVISFTAELDTSENPTFEQNGVIRVNGNIGEINATGLNTAGVTSPASGNSKDIKNEVLRKYGEHAVAEQQALWTFNLNQHSHVLTNTNETVNVVDILPAGLTLDPTSIKLYKNVIGTNGNFVTGSTITSQGEEVEFDYTYTYDETTDRYTLTVTLPTNDTAYILKFATDISNSLLGTQITNSAFYQGETQTGDDDNTSVMSLSSTTGGGSTTKASVTVNKESKDTGEAVDGGIFTLNWLKGWLSVEEPGESIFVRSLTTTSGAATFYGLTLGEYYSITETAAPSGYLLDDPDARIIPVEEAGNIDTEIFENTPIKTGSWTPEAIKNLEGKSIVRDFSFDIKQGEKVVLEGKTNALTSPTNVIFNMAEGVDPEGVLNYTDSYTFGDDDPIGTSHLVTTQTFTMNENDEAIPGYVFDDTVYTLVVKVYNVKGTADLQVVVEDENGNVLSNDNGQFNTEDIPEFNNTYSAEGSLTLEGSKITNGHALADDQFHFELYEGDTLLQTVSNDAGELQSSSMDNGDFEFSPIQYTHEDVGTKEYRIVEKNDSAPGYTYDDTVYYITVDISDDNDDGTLVSEISKIEKQQGEGEPIEVESIVFENDYTAEDLDVTLSGLKTMSGMDLGDNEFTFTLTQTDSDGNPLEELETVNNDNGDIDFSPLEFSQENRNETFYYQVTEGNAQIPGVTCDDSKYSVTVTIKDNNDGTLSSVIAYYLNGEEVNGIHFNNVYSAADTLTITGTKTLSGRSLSNEEFGFALQQIDPNSGVPIGELVTTRNNANGDISFPELNYLEADNGKMFVYSVYELNENSEGMTYDPTKYQVKVVVSDMGDGTLELDKTIFKEDSSGKLTKVDEISFNNEYQQYMPKTSDNSHVLMFTMLILLAVLGIIYSYKMKEKTKN